MKNSELLPKMMGQEEVRQRLELLRACDRNDFYTDGKLDLSKARDLGILSQISGFTCDKNGEVIGVLLNGDHSGWVYLFHAENGLTKIGQTDNIEKRFASICHSSPIDVKKRYSCFVSNMGELERKLHRLFKKNRIRGEWFDLTDEQIQIAIDIIELDKKV